MRLCLLVVVVVVARTARNGRTSSSKGTDIKDSIDEKVRSSGYDGRYTRS